MTPSATIAWYDARAVDLAAAYEAVDPDGLHAWLADLLPAESGLVLDVGAGSGRDAAWFARRGHSVIADEPATAMRAAARARHPEAAISWVDDTLPALNQVQRQGHAFHVILLSGVWQHVLPAERPRALRKLLGLLRAGGRLALSLRHGSDEAARGMYPVSLDEVERLARAHGAMVERAVELPDQLSRPGVSWTGVVLRLPDDGTGALPLLQMPRNAGADGLGFAGAGFRALVDGLVSRLDLRIGARFVGAQAGAVHAALQEAADVITKMPATYITYPNGARCCRPFDVVRHRSAVNSCLMPRRWPASEHSLCPARSGVLSVALRRGWNRR